MKMALILCQDIPEAYKITHFKEREPMPQQQKIVEVELKSGKRSKAIATGNNAAWICKCKRKTPLLGRAGLVDRLADGFRVDCPDCNCSYYVIPDGEDQGAVLRVIEV